MTTSQYYVKQQAITWANFETDPGHDIALLDHN